jgi:hypothetical protein
VQSKSRQSAAPRKRRSYIHPEGNSPFFGARSLQGRVVSIPFTRACWSRLESRERIIRTAKLSQPACPPLFALPDNVERHAHYRGHEQKVRKPRAITAYNLFMKDTIAKIKSDADPDVKNTDALKLVGVRWKEITVGEKAKYELKAKELKEMADGEHS